ncbi:hypothetical protein PMIN07_004016 [Paraphaeosphaeria minitans]
MPPPARVGRLRKLVGGSTPCAASLCRYNADRPAPITLPAVDAQTRIPPRSPDATVGPSSPHGLNPGQCASYLPLSSKIFFLLKMLPNSPAPSGSLPQHLTTVLAPIDDPFNLRTILPAVNDGVALVMHRSPDKPQQ